MDKSSMTFQHMFLFVRSLQQNNERRLLNVRQTNASPIVRTLLRHDLCVESRRAEPAFVSFVRIFIDE